MEPISSDKSTEYEERNIGSRSSQKDTESKEQNVCEINTAELIALNEAAIEGRTLPDLKANASQGHVIAARASQGHIIAARARQGHVIAARASQGHIIAARANQGQVIGARASQGHVIAARASQGHVIGDIELESVGSTLTPRTQAETVSNVKEPGNNEEKSRLLEKKDTTQLSEEKDNNKVDHVKISEKENTSTAIRKDKENKENCLPLPNIVQLQSHSANSCYVPSTQVMLY